MSRFAHAAWHLQGEGPMVHTTLITLLLSAGAAAGQSQSPAATTSTLDLAPLFANIWRISNATPYTASGSIYIFLRNGTLLETSCVETYRIATWKADPMKPRTVEVTEDSRVVFAATISASTSHTLNLRQTMMVGNHEVREVTLTAIDKEFVCPDMPK
jgi:hypothetical protein